MNIKINNIDFQYDHLHITTNSLNNEKKGVSKLFSKIFGPDTSTKHQLLASAQQSKDIFELRTYLANYIRQMEKPPRLTFDEMPSELVTTLCVNMIITSLKSGFSKAATYTALNEFLLSLQKNSLTTKNHRARKNFSKT